MVPILLNVCINISFLFVQVLLCRQVMERILLSWSQAMSKLGKECIRLYIFRSLDKICFEYKFFKYENFNKVCTNV